MRIHRSAAVFVILLVLACSGALGSVVLPESAVSAYDADWAFVGAPMGDTLITDIIIDPLYEDLWYVTSINGVYITRDGGTSWEKHLSSYGLRALAVDPSNPSTVYASSLSRLYRSDDRGRSWQLKKDFSVGCIDSMLVRWADRSVFVCPAGVGGIYKSVDRGDTWQFYSYGVTETNLRQWDIEEDRANGVLYVATEIAHHPQPYDPPFLRSMDGGRTWQDVSGPLYWHATRIQVHPETHAVYAMMEGGSLFRSDNFGQSWLLLDDTCCLWEYLIDPHYPDRVFQAYVEGSGASRSGVYVSIDAAVTPNSLGLRGVWPDKLAVNGLSTRLYALEYGTGIYATELLPDLRVMSMSPQPVTVHKDEPIELTVTIKNTGLHPAGPFVVSLYLDRQSAPPPGEHGQDHAAVAGLTFGESTEVVFDVAYHEPGVYYLWVQVDYNAAVAESDEDNNVYGPVQVNTLGLPDLTISQLSPQPLTGNVGEELGVTVTIKNTGDADAVGGFYVDIYEDRSSPPTAVDVGDESQWITSLAAGASTDVPLTVKYDVAGTYALWAQVDRSDRSAESDETNNILGPVEVKVQGPCTICLDPWSFSFSATQGGASPPSQTLGIWNCGDATLHWSLSSGASWLNFSPAQGSSSGEVTTAVLWVDSSGLDAGIYSTDITLSATGATNTPQTIRVSLIVEPAPSQPPVQPAIVWPPDGTTGVSLTATISSSPFSDPDSGDTHGASQWQITDASGDFYSPVFDSQTDGVNLTQIALASSALANYTTYCVRVRYQDNRGTWSDWSQVTSFTTIGYTITFDTDPAGTGTITFDGTGYSDGQTAGKAGGTYTIQANPGAGYAFSRWEVSGGIAGTSLSSTTTCTVHGDGTLRMVQSAVPMSVWPRHGNRGDSLEVVITGTNFDGTNSVEFGPGIEVTGYEVDSSHDKITVQIAIAGDAAAGPRNISVTAAGGSCQGEGCFTVEGGQGSGIPAWVWVVIGLALLSLATAAGLYLARRRGVAH